MAVFFLLTHGWSGEGSLVLHLVELLHQLFELGWLNLLQSLLKGLSLGLLRDVELSFQELLELIQSLGLVVRGFVHFGALLDFLLLVDWSHGEVLLALLLGDVS